MKIASSSPKYFPVAPLEKGQAPSVEHLVHDKHCEYYRKAVFFSIFYYMSRLSVGISAVLLPFVLRTSQYWATVLSIIVLIMTVLDQVFAPKEKWVLYSKATDMFAVARFKAKGQYEENKDLVDLITQTETGKLQQLVGLSELIAKVKNKTE